MEGLRTEGARNAASVGNLTKILKQFPLYYKDWVISDPEQASRLETIVKILGYAIPGQSSFVSLCCCRLGEKPFNQWSAVKFICRNSRCCVYISQCTLRICVIKGTLKSSQILQSPCVKRPISAFISVPKPDRIEKVHIRCFVLLFE